MTTQIIIESIVISLFSLFIALVLHSLLFQTIEDVLQIDGLSFANREYWYLYFIVMAVVYGFIASIYPARYITSTEIAQSIKGVVKFSGKGKRVRNILLILQFSFTIMLIIGSIAINKQIMYWHNFNTGINTESIVYLHTTSNIKEHSDAFAKELLKDNNIIDYTYSSFVPGAVWMKWGRTIDDQNISITCWPIDERFLDFFNIEITEGRKFSENIEADKDKFIINQAAVKTFNWDKPLEKKMQGFGFDGEIIGVAKDFNFSSLKENIQPMQFWLTNERYYVIMLKISNGNITESIKHIESTWNKFEQEATFGYTFLDDKLQEQYAREEGIAYFIEFVALWSILLSITGLLGLALFVARQRTKEIGIRRANGASIKEILLMLNYDFVKWVLIAFVIAAPVAYYAVNKWLESFAYRTEISWWVFALAGLFTLFISVLAVSIQTFRVASKNPVKALRYE
jgi:putative ABC transport system permease protein